MKLHINTHCQNNQKYKEEQKLYGLKYNVDYKYTGLVNDLDGGAPFWPSAMSGDKLYQVIDASKFIEWSELSGSEKMKEVAVLVVAKLK